MSKFELKIKLVAIRISRLVRSSSIMLTTKKSAVFQGGSTAIGPSHDVISVSAPEVRENLRAANSCVFPLTLMLSAFPYRDTLIFCKSPATVLRTHIWELMQNKLH